MVSKKNRLLAPVYARMTCRLRFGLGKGGCKANGAFQKRKMCGCTPLPPVLLVWWWWWLCPYQKEGTDRLSRVFSQKELR